MFDYVVVGSGAGGGPLACNLARAGHRVALVASVYMLAEKATDVILADAK